MGAVLLTGGLWLKGIKEYNILDKFYQLWKYKMNKRIEVLVDIYKNYFGDDYQENPYVYDNIRAVNSDDEQIVNECLERMQKENSSLLLKRDICLPRNSDYPICEKDRKCYLNIQTNTFESN
ncbi:hypothetical protein [Glaesserella parasuis]|uniref:Uncharacterized protein n=2 Tax=Glaesserella parasuis TaxID=738 RepID=A0A859IIQ1_GLAPU|nr:hypothetical protein [Glaesserella parasuis]QKY73905.1 hypothetical protein FLK62_12375 [Glaesserella parasuis]